MKILTQATANAKIEKGIEKGFNTTGKHFLPDKEICKFASLECFNLCLNLSGRGVFNNVQKARYFKTLYFKTKQNEFMLQLVKELKAFIKSSIKKGLIPVYRPNLTSDINFKDIIIPDSDGKNIFQVFPDLQCYDYTKDYKKMLENIIRPIKNYNLTFSYNGHNLKQCKSIIKSGNNIAVVFSGKTLPKTFDFNGLLPKTKVIDGNLTDLRFLDEKPVIVGLTAKGKARQAINNRFVVNS